MIPDRRLQAVGLMCGTSFDGIDAAWVEIPGPDRWSELRVLSHVVEPFAEVKVERLRDLAAGAEARAAEISELRFSLARDEARAVRRVLGVPLGEAVKVDYVAAHGVTLCHRPDAPRAHGWQLHCGAVLAADLGCPVVDEFRAADLGVGAQGAPLAPLVDLALRSSEDEDRAILNLGGVANITLLPAGCQGPEEVICGDVGPANLPLDHLARRHLGRDYDEDGTHADRGRVNHRVVEEFLREDWVDQGLPRSFGREQFGEAWVAALESAMPAAPVEDLLATVVAIEVRALVRFVERFASGWRRRKTRWRCYLTGGGRHNRAWWKRAQAEVPEVEIRGVEDLGISPDAKEAVDFAYLGGQALRGRSVGGALLTGARDQLVLGSIHDPWGRRET